MTEQCKICKRSFVKINISHLRTHNMTREQYDKADTIQPVTPDKDVIKTIWDSMNTSSIEYKMKASAMDKGNLTLRSQNNVMVQDGRICPECNDKIYEPYAYVSLSPGFEQTGRILQEVQYIKHKQCTIATGSIYHKMAVVPVPRR